MPNNPAAEHTPTANTKIEQLVDALEDFVIGITLRTHFKLAHLPEPLTVDSLLNHAIPDVKEAFRAFLAPTLRLASGSHQSVTTIVPAADQVTCAVCHQGCPCPDVGCPHWARAVRKVVCKVKDDAILLGAPDPGPGAA